MLSTNFSEYSIICVGDLCADLIIPYGKTKESLEKLKEDPRNLGEQKVIFRSGGSVGNTAKVLGKLDQNPIFVTKVGNDNTGFFLKDEMEKSNVNMNYATLSEKGAIICPAVLDENNDRTMFTWVPPWADYDNFTQDSFSDELYEKPAILFSSGMALSNKFESGKAVLTFFKNMKKANSLFVFDLNIRAETYGFDERRKWLFEQTVELADIIIGSGIEEFGPITGKKDLLEAINILKRDERFIIARDGGNPVLVWQDERLKKIDVEKINPVSTVGAGDTFNAAFLTALRKGLDITGCVIFANKVAGYMISHEEHLAIPDKGQIDKLLLIGSK